MRENQDNQKKPGSKRQSILDVVCISQRHEREHRLLVGPSPSPRGLPGDLTHGALSLPLVHYPLSPKSFLLLMGRGARSLLSCHFLLLAMSPLERTICIAGKRHPLPRQSGAHFCIRKSLGRHRQTYPYRHSILTMTREAAVPNPTAMHPSKTQGNSNHTLTFPSSLPKHAHSTGTH